MKILFIYLLVMFFIMCLEWIKMLRPHKSVRGIILLCNL